VLAGQSNNAVAAGSELVSLLMLAKNFEKESESRLKGIEQRPEIAFEKDFLRWMLSDGAGAVLLQNKPAASGLSLKIEWIDILSHANAMEACMYCGADKDETGYLKGWREYDSQDEIVNNSIMSLKQDVKLLNEHIIEFTIEKSLPATIKKHDLDPEQIDYFLPHISSEYFRHRVAKGMENIGFPIPQEKWFTNLATCGNIGSASMFVMLEELFKSGQLKAGNKLLCFVPESGRFSTSFMLLTVVQRDLK
jgi:3-oxoacyl-[acyl-carrier-protein] synthase-3